MKRRLVLSVLAVVVLATAVLLNPFKAHGNACASNGTGGGNWNTAATWTSCGGTTPQSGDTVAIAAGDTVTLDTSPTITSLTFNAGATAAILSDDGSNRTLTISGTVTIGQPTSAATNAWNINGGTATVAGLITFSGSTNDATKIAKIVTTTGTLNANGGITFTASNSASAVIDMSGGAGNLNMKGALTAPGASSTFTMGTTSNFNYDDSSAQTINYASAGSYNNLLINNAGGATLSADITTGNVAGDVLTQSGTLKNGGFAIAGNSGKTFSVSNSAAFEMSGTSAYPSGFSTFTYGASSTVRYLQTTTPLSITSATYGNLDCKPAGAATQNFPTGSITVAGTLTVGDGTNAASVSLNANSTTLSVGVNVTIAASSTLTANASNTLTVTGSWSNSGTFTNSSGTVLFNAGATGKTLAGTLTGATGKFYNLTFNNASGGWTFSAAAEVVHDLTITAGTVTAPSAATLTVSNNYSNSGTFTNNSGTVSFTSTGSKTLSGTMTGSSKFYNVIFNNAFATWTYGADVETQNDFTLSAGTVDASAASNYNLTVGGNLTLTTGTYKAQASTITVSGNWTQSVTSWNTAATGSGTSTVILKGSSKTITTAATGSTDRHFYNLTMFSGSNYSINSGSRLNVFHNFDIEGTIQENNACSGSNNISFFGTTGATLTIAGTLSGSSGGCVYVDGGGGTPTMTYGGTISISNFIYTLSASNTIPATNNGSGNIAFQPGSGSQTYTIGGAITSSNTISLDETVAHGTLTWDNSVNNSTITGNKFSILSDAGAYSVKMGSASYAIASDWTNGDSATVDAGTSTATFSATNNLTSGGQSFYNVTVSGGTTTPQDAMVVTNDINFTGGTFAGTQNVTVNGNVAGTSGGAVSLTGGTFEQRVASAKNFGATTGSTGWTFNDLTFSNSTASTPLTITTQTGGTGIITVSDVLKVGKSGDNVSSTTTLSAGNRTWTLPGTTGSPFQLLASPAAVLTGATSTFNYTGDNAGGSTTIQVSTGYNLLTVNNASETYVLAGTTTAASTVTVTNGTFDTVSGGNYTLSAGRISIATGGTFLANNSAINITSTGTLFTRTGSGVFTAGGSTVSLITGGTASLNSGTVTFNNLTVNRSGATLTTLSAITVNNDFTITAGTVGDNGNQIVGNATGTLSTGASGALTIGSTAGATVFPTNFTAGHISLDPASTVTYNCGTTQTISSTPTAYGNLTLTRGGGLGAPVKTPNGAIVAAGNLTINANNTYDTSSGNNYALTIGGNYTNSGTFTAQNGTVTFNATTTGKTVNGTLSGGSAFYDLTFNGSGGGWTMGAVSTVSDNLAISNGTLDDGGFQITGNATGTFTMSSGTTLKLGSGTATTFPATFTTGHTTLNAASTVIYNSTTTQTISSTPSAYGHLQLSAASGTPTKTPNGAIVAAGNVTIDASNTYDTSSGNNYALTIGGSYTNNGTFTAQNGTVTFNATSSGKTLSGSMTSGSAFYDLTFNGVSGAWTLSNAVAAGHDFTLTNGDVTAGSNALTVTRDYTLANTSGVAYHAGTSTVTVTRHFTDSGAKFDKGTTSTIAMNGTGTITTAAGESLFNLSMGYSTFTTTTTLGNPTYVYGAITFNGGTVNSTSNAYLQSIPTAGSYVPYIFASPTTITGSQKLFVYNAASDVTIAAGDYGSWSMELGAYYTNSTSFLLAGNVTTTSGFWVYSYGDPTGVTFDTQNHNLTVGSFSIGTGSTTNGVAFTFGSSTVTVSGDFAVLSNGGANSLNLGTSSVSVTGDLKLVNGTGTIAITPGTSTVTMSPPNATTKIYTPNGQSLYNFTINGSGGTVQPAGAVIATHDFTITAGTYDTVSGSNYALTVGRNFANSGTFTANSGTVTLNGSAQQTVSGTNTGSSAFYNLTITNSSGASATDNELTGFTAGVVFSGSATSTGTYTITTANVRVQYLSGATYTFNNITWNGQAKTTRIFFRNSAASGTWLLKVTGTQTGAGAGSVSSVNVSRSDASVAGGSAVIANDTTDYNAGNNTNWTFGTTITVSGNIYIQGSESTQNTTPVSVSLSVNNGAPSTVASQTTTYSMVNTYDGAGAVVTVYIDGDASLNANTFTISTGSDITSLDLFINRTAIYNHNSGNTTNANICAQSTYPTAGDATFTCSSSVPTFTGDELHVAGGYAPGGNVNAPKLHLVTGGTYTGGSETLTLSGSGTSTSRPLYINGGTFTPTSDTVTFTGTSASDIEATTYNDLQLYPSSGTQTYTLNSGTVAAHTLNVGNGSTLTVDAATNNTTVTLSNNLTINSSTVWSAAANTLSIGGSYANSGTFTANSGSITFTATSGTKTLTGTLNGGSAFYDLIFNGSGGTWTLGAVSTVSHHLTITAGTVDDTGNQITGNATGTFTMSSGTTLKLGAGTATLFPTNFTLGHCVLNAASTIVYNATVNQSISGVPAYGSIQLSRASGTPTKTALDDLILNGSLTIDASNTLDMDNSGNYALVVKTNYTNNGTFTARAGTTTFNATSSGKTLAGTMTGSSAFYSLVFNGVSGAWTFSNAVAATNDFTVTNGSVTAGNNNLTVTRDFTLANTSGVAYTAGTSTVAISRHLADPGGKGSFNSGATVQMNGTGSLNAPESFSDLYVGYSGFTTTVSSSYVLAAPHLEGGTVTAASGGYRFQSGSVPVFDSPTSLTGGGLFLLQTGNGLTLTLPGANYGDWSISMQFSAGAGATFAQGGAITTTGDLSFYDGGAGGNLTYNTANYGLTANSFQLSSNAEPGIIANFGSSTVSFTSTSDALSIASNNPNTAVLNLQTSSVTVTGNVKFANGTGSLTVNPGSSTLTWGHSSGTKTYAPNGQSLYNITLNCSGGTVQPSGAVIATHDFTITAGTYDTVSGQNYALTIGGSYSNSGTFTAQNGTVTFNSTSSGKTLAGTLTGSTGKFYNLTFSGSGGAWAFSAAGEVANNFTITTGTVTAPSSTLTITGSYSNSATFTHNSGTVTFNSTASGKTLAGTMTSGSAFYNLVFNGGSGAWTFSNAVAAGNDFTVTNGAVTASNNNLTVTHDFTLANTSGVAYTAGSSTITVSHDFNDVAPKLSGASATLTLDGTGALNTPGGETVNNLNLGYTSKTTTLASFAKAAVNNTLTFNGGTVTGSNSELTANSSTSNTPVVFNSATTLNGSGSNSVLYQINSGSITVTVAGADYGSWGLRFAYGANTGTFNLGGAVTTTNQFTQYSCGSTGGTLNTQGYAVAADHIQFGFSVCTTAFSTAFGASTVTLSNTGDALYPVSGGGTFPLNLGSATVDSKGNILFLNSSGSITVTAGTSTIKWTHTSGTKTYAPNGQSLYNIELSCSGGTVQPSAAVIATNDLTMTAGTLNGTQNITVNGNVAGTAGIVSLTGGTFEQRVGAAKNFGTTSGSTAWTFYDLTFSNSHGSSPFTVTAQTGGTGGLTITDVLKVGKSGDAAGATTTLNAGNRTWTLSGTTGDSFQFLASPAAALVGGTSKFYYTGNNGSGNTTIQSMTSSYYDLEVNNGSETFVLEGDTVVEHSLTITAGTLDTTGSNFNLTVGGNFANSGTFTANSGRVTLNGSAQQTVSGTNTGSSAFYNLTITNNSGASATDNERTGFTAGVVFAGSATSTGTYTITTANVRIEYHTGSTYTFNSINWNGQAKATRIFFRNSAASGTWLLKVTGTQTAVTAVNVSRSDASVAGGNTIVATDGTDYDAGNNTNWNFGSTITVSGNIYIQGSESTQNSTPVSVSLSVNNGEPSTIANQTTTYSMANTYDGAGAVLVVYIDGDGSLNANTFTISSGSNITSLDLFINRTAIYNHNSGNTTNANICGQSTYPTAGDTTFTCSSGVPTFTGDEVHLAGGYAPGGNVNAPKLHVFTGGIYTGGSETLTLSGSGTTTSRPLYINGGTFTTNSNTVTYTGTSATDVESTTYSNLQLYPSSGTQTYTIPTGTFTVNGNLDAGNGSTLTVDDNANSPTVSIGGNLTINSSTTWNNSPNLLTITGSYANSGTFTANSASVTFNSTASGKTLSGNMTSSSAFYKIAFSGTGGAWTIQNAITITADATDTLNLTAGTVTLGNSSGDNLEVRGTLKVAATANQTATFQTGSIAATGTITVDINQNNSGTPPACTNCTVTVGATSGSGTGTFIINKNGILRLNPDSTQVTDLPVAVNSTGFFKALGTQDYTGTSTAGTSETELVDSGKSWTTGENTNKWLRMTAGLAKGQIYPITGTSATQVTRASTESAAATMTVTGSSNTRLVCSDSQSLLSADHVSSGRYVHDKTGSTGYLQIIDSKNNDGSCSGSTDSFTVIANPDSLAILSNGNTFTLSDGVQSGDTYEILDPAYVTAEAGTACTATVNEGGKGEAYVTAAAGSQTLIQYAGVCNLGRNSTGKYGLVFTSINGGNSNEGVTVDKSKLNSNYYGLYGSALASDTLTNNLSTGNSVYGLYLTGDNSSTTISNNLVTSNSSEGFYLTSVSNTTVSSTSAFANATAGISVNSSNGNTFSSNTALGNTSYGIYLGSSNRNTLSSNTAEGGATAGIGLSGSSGNTLATSTVISPAGSGILLTSSSANNAVSGSSATSSVKGIDVSGSVNNTLASNTLSKNSTSGLTVESTSTGTSIYSNTISSNASGLVLSSSNGSALFGNTVSGNTKGLYVTNASTGTTMVSGSYSSNTTADIDLNATASTLSLYNTTLGSATRVSGDSDSGAYLISRKADTTSGKTQIWGHYTIPANVSETPQTESTDTYSYVSALWVASATAHTYSGTGTEDSSLDYDLSSTDLSAGPYQYRLVAATNSLACGSTTFTVYRNGTSVGTATCGSLFTDSNASVNVKFKIDGGVSPSYVLGDTYTFTVWDASGDSNVKKLVQLMTTDGSFTVPSGKTLTAAGQSATANPTEFTRGFPAGGWHMVVAGTINAQYYNMSYLGGTSGANGLDLQSGATVTNIANGTFDNFQTSGGGSDTYINVGGSLIGTGSPAKTFDSLVFTMNGSVPAYTVTESGGSPSNGNYWSLTTATCNGWSTCEDSDSDAGDGAGAPNADGFIRFVPTVNPNPTVDTRIKSGTTRVKGGTVQVK